MEIKLNSVKALFGNDLTLEVDNIGVFFGLNNSGKSSILIGACHAFMLKQDFTMDYLGPDRFISSRIIQMGNFEQTNLQEERRKSRCGLGDDGMLGRFDPLVEYTIQDEKTREKIDLWFNLHFENIEIIEIRKNKYEVNHELKVNGQHITMQGSGALAALPIITQLYNPNVKFLAIDEPEISLEPRAQKIILKAIKDASQGKNGFPKKTIIIATHSHLFLDKEEPSVNYKVGKIASRILVTKLQTAADVQDAVFNLLGNDPGDLFFPSNIILVEGLSDTIFYAAVQTKLIQEGVVENKKVVFHATDSFSKTHIGLKAINAITAQTHSIYADRICGLFDTLKQQNEIDMFQSIKNERTNANARFKMISESDIEYIYPLDIVNKAFNSNFTTAEYRREIDTYLKSKKFKGTHLTKEEFAKKVALEFLSTGRLSDIDSNVISIISEAHRLGY